MPKKIVQTAKAPNAVGPYSQAIIANGFVYTAGQIPLIPGEGKIVEGDIQTQTRQVLDNLQAVLEGAGTSLANVVKTTVFLSNLNDFGAMNEVYGRYFSQDAPARATVEAARLPRDARVEIEAIAMA